MKRCFVAQLTPALVSALVASSIITLARADQVEMQNGDRYHGKVLSLNADSLTLQNEVLGKITLPRAKVALISFGTPLDKTERPAPATNVLSKLNSPAATNSFAAQLSANSNVIQMVQRQFLAGADPAAQDKFNEMVSGLLSGKLTVEDIRREAKSAADQMRALKKEAGEDAGFAVDAYLAILDRFVKEAPAPPTQPTNSPTAKSRPTPVEEEQ